MSTGPRLPNSFGGWAIWIVIAIAICAVVYTVAGAVGIPIPGWVVQLVFICIVAVIAWAAIRFLMSLGGER
jgi:hypothetical protein